MSSPRITHVSWGTVKVDGHGSFKDVKLHPDGARAWDWNETGTSHVPGIQPADVEELLDHGAKAIVLTKGMNERLQVQDETLQRLNDAGIETYVLQTESAVDRYNDLVDDGTAVGALVHSTC